MALGRAAAHEPEVVANPIVDDDRVVERVAEHGQDRAQHGEVERPARQREDARRDEHVVQRGDDGADGELPAEAQHHVDEHENQREQQREAGVLEQILADLRADDYAAAGS